MKHIITLILVTILFQSNAQVAVALHSSGGTQIFNSANPFLDAYAAAVDGDTIYLPGGLFTNPASIEKRLTIYGAGIHVDSTQATLKTRFNSSILFDTGSDSSHIEGVFINGTLGISTNTKVDNLVIKRNYFNSFTASGTNTANKSDNIQLIENVVGGNLNFQHISNGKIFNNIIRSISNLETGWVANNFFYNQSGTYPLTSVNYSLIENNYISTGYGFNSVHYCSFINNIFNNDPTGDTWNTYTGNYTSLSEATVIVNGGTAIAFETSNFHLIDPATYIGTTGDQVSIYGGYYPAKEGFVPVNPHIRTVNIAPSTTPAGDLNITIEVGAQDN